MKDVGACDSVYLTYATVRDSDRTKLLSSPILFSPLPSSSPNEPIIHCHVALLLFLWMLHKGKRDRQTDIHFIFLLFLPLGSRSSSSSGSSSSSNPVLFCSSLPKHLSPTPSPSPSMARRGKVVTTRRKNATNIYLFLLSMLCLAAQLLISSTARLLNYSTPRLLNSSTAQFLDCSTPRLLNSSTALVSLFVGPTQQKLARFSGKKIPMARYVMTCKESHAVLLLLFL